ncbi:MAG: glycosyltransferase family 2 protein, partial [Endomicrobiia bacterium]|nr:glycosyltransferase family 2 protein [Endomicrobiia bacterium]
MNKLSCVLIVRNEERRIERCLKALSWADETVVIDQKSADKTVDIARAYTPNVFETEPKLICNPDREYGISKASHKWVLLIEADEIVDEGLRREIVSVLDNPSRDIYFVPVKSFFAGKWIKNCGWYPAYIPRLFKKGAVVFQSDIHTNGRFMSDNIGRLESDLLHYSYDRID